MDAVVQDIKNRKLDQHLNPQKEVSWYENNNQITSKIDELRDSRRNEDSESNR